MLKPKGKTAIVLLATLLFTAACGNSGEGGGSAASESANGTTADSSVKPANKSDEKIKISFYSYNLAIASQKAATEQLIEEFEAENPTIEIEPIAVPSTELATKVQADIAAGARPDVAQIVFDSLDYAVQNYGAKALEDIVAADELRSNFEGFSPSGMKLGQLQGKTYGLAFTFSTPVLFYNASLFEQAGLDPASPPTTWEEVKQYALRIASETDAAGVHIGGSTGNDWLVQALIGSNGGNVLSDDRKTILFGESEAASAIGMWQDLVLSGAHSKITDGEIVQAFSEQKLGMLLFTSALQSAFVTGSEAGGWELRTAKMPAFGDKPTTPVNSGSALVILSDDQAKQDAAWKFLQFATSDRGYTIITSQMGYLPLRPAIIEDPNYLKEWVAANPLVQPNLEQLESLRPWVAYPGPQYYQIETTLLEGVQKSIQSTGDVGQIMRDAQKRAQSMMP